MRHPIRRSRAFSLVELLVVIGIITLLIGILIPVISSVRKSAWKADTKNLISQLSSAILRYHQDHAAYPGVFSNSQVMSGVSIDGGAFVAGGTPAITMSENLVLSLVGGTRFDNTEASKLRYDEDALKQSRGPVSANPANPKRYPAYLTATENMLSNGLMADTDVPGMTDSEIPEFLDTWPIGDQLPIIYLRARAGATGIISDNGTYQYDLKQITPYRRSTDGPKALGNGSEEITDKPGDNAVAYFKLPSTTGTNNATGTPREKDRFVLIAAGEDRIFGTNDDIVSWGDR